MHKFILNILSLSLLILVSSASVASFAGTVKASPSPSSNPCRKNPNYGGEGDYLCIGSCENKDEECITGIPPGAKDKKAICHCATKRHPKKK